MSKQLDNFKQMLNSVQYDIRALLVKLADRLHNMRTLSSMRPDKQMKIAGRPTISMLLSPPDSDSTMSRPNSRIYRSASGVLMNTPNYAGG